MYKYNFNYFKSAAIVFLALTMNSTAVVPLITTSPVLAQSRFLQRQQLNLVLRSGTYIPVRYDKDKIVVMPDETMPLTLTVASNITSADGKVVIPEGSQITGELKPTARGTQFVAKELTLYRRRLDQQTKPFSINGNSDVVRRIEQVKKGASTTSILQGAAVGGAAAAALAALTGDHAIATEELLGGAGLGALGGFLLNRKTVDAVVIYPERDLSVRLTSEFARRS